MDNPKAMTELTITLAIVSPVIAYFIGRYFSLQSNLPIGDLKNDVDFWCEMYLAEKEFSGERKKLFDEAMELANNRNARVLELQNIIKDLQTINATLEEQLKNKP